MFLEQESRLHSKNKPPYTFIPMKIKSFEKQFNDIYRDQSDVIFRFCLIRVSDREQALDLVQETFTRLWQTISAGKEMTNTRAFLFTVANRLIIDWYRRKKPVSFDALADPDTGEEFDPADPRSEENIVSGSEGRRLIDSIGRLDPSYRQAVYLRYVEDLSPQEIGEILGISANAASVRITRGLGELRKISGFESH
jgi:RNA polymerase sigma-70 factor (ECF subfamily)